MEGLSTIRAEIKSWERTFKGDNGRAPTIEDIKNQPAIAEKYKLYKRLSRSSSAVSDVQVASSSSLRKADIPGPPSTPSRPSPATTRQSVLLSHTRPAQNTAPLTSFNPFSPQKKGKQTLNPLLSSSKSPSKYRKSDNSLEDSSSPQDSTHEPSYLLPSFSTPAGPVFRARKRLRGEPVSPSPSKEKRRRVEMKRPALFALHDVATAASGDEDQDVDVSRLSFVDDSPKKPFADGKSFRLLFNESGLPDTDLDPGKKNSEAKANSNDALSNTTLDMDWELESKRSTPKTEAKKATLLKTKFSPTSGLGNQDHQTLSVDDPQVTPAASAKRSLPETSVAKDDLSHKTRLIPPSPTGANPHGRGYTNAKGKEKAMERRLKKAKVEEGDEDTDTADEHEQPVKLKLVSSKHARSKTEAGTGSNGDDSELLLRYPHYSVPLKSEMGQSGNCEIDLPEALRRVLALHPTEWKAKDSQERKVVKSLLYGQRLGHYEPNRGGEIWSVGESDVAGESGDEVQDIDGINEEDWESEPIPWAAGEL